MELYHHGIKGQRWGVRRFQNEDGSLTSRGKKHNSKLSISNKDSSVTKRVKNDYNNMDETQFRNKYQVSKKKYAKRVEKYGDPYMNAPLAKIGKKLAKKEKEKLAKKEKFIKKTDETINLYGKNVTKALAAANIGITTQGMVISNKMLYEMGKQATFALAKNPNFGRGSIYATSLLTAGAMGAVTLSTLYSDAKYAQMIKLASTYDERHSNKKSK